MTGRVQIVKSLTTIVKKVPLAIYLNGTCIGISLNVFLVYGSKQDGQRNFLRWIRYPSGVSRYTQGTWELKSVVVLSNAQPFTRDLPIYNRVREVPFYIPQGYVEVHSIYRRYVEEPHESWDVVPKNNDSSYVLRHRNTSLSYHSNYKKKLT